MGNNGQTIIDLMEYAEMNETPPKGKRYRFMVKKQMYVVDVESMTGQEICEMAGLEPPTNYKLSMKVKGEYRDVSLDERISFLTPGIEKFTYISRDPIEG